MTIHRTIDPNRPDRRTLMLAAEILRKGGLVAFPTETVYGLGADATASEAVKRIFAAKGRPADNPLIVHLCAPDQIPGLLGPVGERLAARFWPGPLSLIVERCGPIASEVSCGLSTVAVRMPAHPVALGLIELAGVPVAAPSANRSGRPSPTCADHVLEDLAGRVDMILDAGPTKVGVESTVLDLTSSPPAVLRPGAVTLEELREILPEVVAGLDRGGPTRSPGTRYRHYAPRARVVLVEAVGDAAAAIIRREAAAERGAGRRVAALVTAETARAELEVDVVEVLGSIHKLETIASHLFAGLRKVDAQGAEVVFVEAGFAPHGLGAAILDRLRRAAEGAHRKPD